MPDLERVKAAQELRLRFLYAVWDREDAGETMPDTRDLMRDIGITDPDGDWNLILRITDPLRADDMITGISTDQHGLVKISLTPAGRRLVEDRVTEADRVQAPASVGDVKIEGSGNVVQLAQHSPGAHLAADVHYESYDLRKIAKWAGDVDGRLEAHGLQPEDNAEVRARIKELRAELDRPEPDHSKIRRLGRHIVRVLAQTEASLASAGLIEAGQALFGG